ncbi:MAG: calcium/sodium antiporter [Saprospiraceae bacterium]|nr:calcium/sodium antiporter [Saprospiraceae bacterium]
MLSDILLNVLVLGGSLFILVKGSDWFVDSAERIGLSLGVSPFIIGVSIVAFGTSLPELASGISAVLNGNSEIVTGVVVGSNITNILLVLGLVATVGRVVKMDYDIMDIDMPLLLGSAFLMWFCLADQHLSRFEAILFLIGLTIFLLNSLTGHERGDQERPKSSWKDYLLLLLGGVFVKYGADFTVDAISDLAKGFQMDTTILAQTLLALGTSLPEVAVSITAALKGKPGIAVGNVLGSNIFNTYAVMAIPSFFGTLIISDVTLSFYLPFMIACTLLFALISMGGRVTKWEGYMLLLFYLYFFNHSFGIL